MSLMAMRGYSHRERWHPAGAPAGQSFETGRGRPYPTGSGFPAPNEIDGPAARSRVLTRQQRNARPPRRPERCPAAASPSARRCAAGLRSHFSAWGQFSFTGGGVARSRTASARWYGFRSAATDTEAGLRFRSDRTCPGPSPLPAAQVDTRIGHPPGFAGSFASRVGFRANRAPSRRPSRYPRSSSSSIDHSPPVVVRPFHPWPHARACAPCDGKQEDRHRPCESDSGSGSVEFVARFSGDDGREVIDGDYPADQIDEQVLVPIAHLPAFDGHDRHHLRDSGAGLGLGLAGC